MRNKLAYLGFLGVLGFGGFWGTPLLFAYFAFFAFFAYAKVVPDELFKANVRICATRGFFTFLVPACAVIVATLLLQESDSLSGLAARFALTGFGLILAASLLVFCITLEYLERKEKRSKDDGEES